MHDNIQKDNQGYKVGDIAADFKLRNVDNKFVSLSDIKSQGYIIIFTCNHCPFSIAYEDRIIALDKKYKSKGFPVIAINPNDPEVQPKDSFEAMQQRAKEKGFTFPYLFDEGQKVYPMYGATRTPHVFLLKKTPKGNEVVYIGAIDDNHEDENEVKEKFLENAIEAVIRNEKPSPDVTKAIGCTIKTKKK
jgi:peroxiredoxin